VEVSTEARRSGKKKPCFTFSSDAGRRWSRRDSNSRPNKESKSFLQVYSTIGFRIQTGSKHPIYTLSYLVSPTRLGSKLTSSKCRFLLTRVLVSGTPERNACLELSSQINCNLYRVLRCKRVIIVVVYRLLVLILTSHSLNARLAYSFIHLAVDTGRPQDVAKLNFLSEGTALELLNFINQKTS